MEMRFEVTFLDASDIRQRVIIRKSSYDLAVAAVKRMSVMRCMKQVTIRMI